MKIKQMVACMLIGLWFAVLFAVCILISRGEMTRLEGIAIVLIDALVTFKYAYKVEEEK